MRYILRSFVAVSLVAGLLALAISCSEKSTKPKVEPGMLLYLGDALTGNLYKLDPETDSVLDSIPDLLPIDMVVSADGQWLFAVHYIYGVRQGTAKIRTSDFQIVAEVPTYGLKLVFAENERYLLRPGTGYIDFIDPEDLHVIKTDSINIIAYFDISETTNLILGYYRDSGLFLYDYHNGEILSSDAVNYSGAHYLSLNPDDHSGYGIFTGDGGWFNVFDIPDLQIRSRHLLASIEGQCKPTPDGKYVLITDPGNMYDPVGDLHVYDVTNEAVIKLIRTDTLTLVDGWRTRLTQIEYSPDGSEAYIATGHYGVWNGPVLVFDLRILEFSKRIDLWPETEPIITDIAVGIAP